MSGRLLTFQRPAKGQPTARTTPRVVTQAAMLHQLRPDVSAHFEELYDEVLATIIPPRI